MVTCLENWKWPLGKWKSIVLQYEQEYKIQHHNPIFFSQVGKDILKDSYLVSLGYEEVDTLNIELAEAIFTNYLNNIKII